MMLILIDLSLRLQGYCDLMQGCRLDGEFDFNHYLLYIALIHLRIVV